MKKERSLAYHETIDLHEVLNLKTLNLFKSKMMQGVVFDQDLKALMQKDVEQSLQDMEELQAVYEKAPIH